MRRHGTAGFTFLELMVASVCSAVIGGGTLMAFITAARISSAQLTPAVIEANGLAMQGIERYRNRVAQDDSWLATQVGLGWQTDAPPGGAGSESMQAGARRCFRVTNACGGLCYQVQTQVCWATIASPPCNCP